MTTNGFEKGIDTWILGEQRLFLSDYFANDLLLAFLLLALDRSIVYSIPYR